MRGTSRIAWKVLGALVPALMLFVSGADPWLHRHGMLAEPIAESQHDPADGAGSHDHRLCTQVAANQAVPASPCLRAHVVLQRLKPGLSPATAALRLTEAYAAPSRAPPSA
jgi:hypothetical protein